MRNPAQKRERNIIFLCKYCGKKHPTKKAASKCLKKDYEKDEKRSKDDCKTCITKECCDCHYDLTIKGNSNWNNVSPNIIKTEPVSKRILVSGEIEIGPEVITIFSK